MLAVPGHAWAVDLDGDGVDDDKDNCFEIANPIPTGAEFQCDSDNDGIGNHCDADLDNNCIVNSFDLSLLRDSFGASGPNAADLNCDGIVNSFDLARMREAFGGTPGPSAYANSCVACNEPVVSGPIPMRWVEAPRAGEAIQNSTHVISACSGGTSMDVTTQALIPGNTYTMWFGFFQNPAECLYPPRTPANPDPTLKCGTLDLFNISADPNMRFGDGLVATGVNDTFFGFAATGAPPGGTFSCLDEAPPGTLCQTRRLGWALRDDHTGVLTNPLGAEYQAVLKSHGPEDPRYMPDQIETTDGGCRFGEDYRPCRNPQTAGVNTDALTECFDDPVCAAGLIGIVGYPYVAGIGEGTPEFLPDDTFWLSVTGLRTQAQGEVQIEGQFIFRHTDAAGAVIQMEGEVCALSVSPGNRALVLGRTDPEATAPDIALTIEDSVDGDVISVNVPATTNIPIVGLCGTAPVVDTGTFSATVTNGHFFVNDN